MFVLINIIAATLLDDRFVPRADFSLKAFAERSFGVFQESPVRVAWKFSPRAAPDARTYVFHPNQTVTDLPDGGVLVEFTAGGLSRDVLASLYLGRGGRDRAAQAALGPEREELARHGLNL
jgi:hypothetical protein